MKFLLNLFMLASLILPNQEKITDKINDLNLVSENYILYSVDFDEVIAEKNSDIKIKPASILKILTTITALEELENNELNKFIEVDPKVLATVSPIASIAGFKAYQKITIKEILYGIMLPSGADATALISDYIAGSENEFVRLMNQKAKEIGLQNTSVINASGLDANNQDTTLIDLLTLLQYALKNQTFQEIYSTKTYTLINYPNHKLENAILVQAEEIFDFKLLDGAKSGFTALARRSLSSLASKENSTYIFISTQANSENNSKVLNQALNDAVKVYSYLFNNFTPQEIVIEKSPQVRLKRRVLKKTINIEPFDLMLANEINPEDLIHQFNFFDNLKVPLEKGTIIGQHQIFYQDNLVEAHDIITTSRIGHDPLYYGLWIIVISGVIIVIKSKMKRH